MVTLNVDLSKLFIHDIFRYYKIGVTEEFITTLSKRPKKINSMSNYFLVCIPVNNYLTLKLL